MRCHRTPKCLTLTHETAELINEIMSLVVFLGMKASTRINNNFWKASLAESLFSNPFAGVFNKTYWHRQIKANWGFVWMHRQASELCDVTGVLKTPNWHWEQLTPFFQDATQVLQFTGQESVSGSLFFLPLTLVGATCSVPRRPRPFRRSLNWRWRAELQIRWTVSEILHQV